MNFTFTDEQNLIRDTYRDFCKKELTPEYVRWMDENCDFIPEDLWQKLADLGTMGITIPEEYGGSGLGKTESCIVFEELATAASGVAMCAGISACMGASPIVALGNKEQKEKYLPRLAQGELKWALGMTEAGGGTDLLGGIRTTAVKDGDSYVINGSKMFITAAHVADYFTTVVITDKEAKRTRGLSLLMVEAKSPGITVSPIRKVGGHTCGVNEIHFDNVRVPAENLLGQENNGWYQLLKVLNPERLDTSVMSLGIAKAAFNLALDYSQERKAFGKTIGSFQILQHFLVDIAIEIENSQNLIYKCARLMDTGQKYDVEVAMAKIVACRASELAALHGMEILGGYGFTMEFDMQRYFRDYKQMKFSPISDEMAKNYIAESFGLPRSF